MLKSCKYCGRVHDSKYDCGKKPVRRKQNNRKDKFRWSRDWQKKREQIKRRDLYLCQVCIRNLYGTYRRHNYDGIEVHHAVPLEQDFGRQLDDGNLITLCGYHHELAEAGKIPINDILGIIAELQLRKQGKESLVSGKAMTERPEVKNNPAAHKEFKRINELRATKLLRGAFFFFDKKKNQKESTLHLPDLRRFCFLFLVTFFLFTKEKK